MRRTSWTTAAVLTAAAPLILARPAFASPTGAHRVGGEQIQGAGVSHPAGQDDRALKVNAQTPDVGISSASGHVSFTHHSPLGLNHFVGSVSCLQITTAGDGGAVVQLSGVIGSGSTANGTSLAGRNYAFSIVEQANKAQQFSLPRFGGATPCGGGRALVPVTQAGYRIIGT